MKSLPQPTLDHCAVQYAQYWQQTERGLANALASKDQSLRLQGLQRAAGYFKVARSFPKAFDIERGFQRLAPVLEFLESYRSRPPTPDTLCGMVETTRRALGAAYGGRDLLSAATKFLWLLHKDPVVIFDSQARIALGASPADYPGFLRLWHDGYARHSGAIRMACASVQVAGTAGDVVDMAQEWFRRRVYDIYLWNVGAPTSSRMGKS